MSERKNGVDLVWKSEDKLSLDLSSQLESSITRDDSVSPRVSSFRQPFPGAMSNKGQEIEVVLVRAGF